VSANINIVTVAIAALLGCSAIAVGAEIRGTVQTASGETATIAIEGESAPNVGDPVEIFFKLPGADEEISVGSGKVTAVNADIVEAKIEKATGTVSKDQLVRINSQNRQKRTAALSTPAQTQSTATPTRQGPPAVEPSASSFEGIPPTQIVFDDLSPGPLPADAFAAQGIHFIKGRGTPAIYEVQPNMVLLRTRKHVLLVSDERVTSVSITLDRPVRRFALVRVGTTGGASIPTWKMVGYDKTGKIIGRAGEEHGLPPGAKEFSVQGDAIARVELITDNRWGEGTWATWNSLPVSQFVLEP
jgi:hypothetical protein